MSQIPKTLDEHEQNAKSSMENTNALCFGAWLSQVGHNSYQASDAYCHYSSVRNGEKFEN